MKKFPSWPPGPRRDLKKIFYFSEKYKGRRDPSISKIFLSPILLKFHVANPYAKSFSNFKFCKIQRWNIFGIEESSLWIFQKLKEKFSNPSESQGVRVRTEGHTSRCQDTIKDGPNLTFSLGIKVASRPQFLATLMAKQSTGGSPPTFSIKER